MNKLTEGKIKSNIKFGKDAPERPNIVPPAQPMNEGCNDCLDESVNRIVDVKYWNFCPYCGRKLLKEK